VLFLEDGRRCVAATRPVFLWSNLLGLWWLSTVVEVRGSELSDGVDDASAADDVRFVAVLKDALPRVQRVALLLVGDRSAADDLVAEAVARTLPKWRAGGVADPAAYLRRVVANLASRRWRRRSLAVRHDRAALNWLQPTTDDDAAVVERDAVVRAVARLAPRRRAVVVLRFYDDLSEAQIAEVLGVRVGTVKSQLSRGLEQLREDLGTLEQV
jgi:RNA polymerase sigma-70 factor (sigma-E family)